jgi:release factor glutamine methyltransferase
MSVVEFDGLMLSTRRGVVMTPRATSVALVDVAVAHLGDRRCRVVDVGTGSGAIAIAIATKAPNATVWATDRSREAVELATRNAAQAGVSDRVLVREGDLLEPVPGTVDLVVANLPYLSADERDFHPDLRWEPAAAVFAPGDGLGCYRRLLQAAASRLSECGLLALQLRGDVYCAESRRLGDLEIHFRATAA